MTAPKLRFKEFDGEYSLSTIKSIAKIFVGRDLVENAYSLIKTDTHIYPIYSNSVDNQGLYGYYNFEEFNFSDDALTVVGRGAGLGTAFYRQNGFGTIGRLLCLTPKEKTFHPKYLADYINNKLVIHNESGGIPQLPRSSLENYEVVLPEYNEQTKIASFLFAVDEKISQLTQKHELLSQYKQGMMQKLFSQQLRFKADDGNEFGKWEEKKLHQIFQIKAGGDIDKSSVSQVRTSEFSYPIFANSDKNKGFYGWANKFKYKDAVTVTGRGNLGIAVARNEPFYPIVRLLVLLPLVKQNLKFFEEKINLLDIVSESTGVPQLTAPQLSKYKVNVPLLEEQTKIANFLSAIDQKIETVVQQIEQAKTWRKGLLQQMFV